MKIKLISLISVLLIGILVIVLSISKYASVENAYNNNLNAARVNAQKQIPYNAYNFYKAVLEIRCDDEQIYKEFLAQAELLGPKFYNTAVEDYVVRFPNSADAYNLLCELQYDQGRYSTLLYTALEAREKGIATDRVRDLYNECSFMLKTLKSGLTSAQSFAGQYALVEIEGQYGYLNVTGDFQIAAVYPQASAMMPGGGCVNDGDEWHVVNPDGYKIARTSEPVDYMGINVGGKLPISKNGKYAYVNTALQIPEDMPYDYASNFKNGVAAVKKNGKWALVDINENLLTQYIFEEIVLDEFDTCCNGGAIFVKHNGKYFMVNSSGAKITEQAFDNVKPFVSSEPAAVCINGLWGFVDNQGKIVIEPQYQNADSFNIGLGGVCVDDLWGYINSGGTFRIECQFQDCKPFSAAGIAAVKENDFWKYVRLLSHSL